AHVRHRFDHAGQRILRLDFVLEADLTLVPDADERFEQRGEVDHATTDLDLAFLFGFHSQILDVHVVDAIAALAAGLDRLGARAQRVAYVDAQAKPSIP